MYRNFLSSVLLQTDANFMKPQAFQRDSGAARADQLLQAKMPYDLDSIDDDISDEQIERLLQSAEKRLKGGQTAVSHNPDPQPSHQYDYILKAAVDSH